jgi:hypothetical protein
MILTFNPQAIEVKEQGRVEQAKIAGLPLEAAAKYFTVATHKNFQARYNAFVDAFPEEAKRLSDHRPDGVGPGEMVAWFVFDNLTLGGKNSSIDLLIDGKPFAEMKGGAYTISSNSLDNFKLSKDGDQAVIQLLADLELFNSTYRKITGYNLSQWTPGKVGLKVLRTWENIDLIELAKIHRGPARERMMLPIDPNGDVWSLDAEQRVTNLGAPDALRKITEIVQSDRRIAVDSNVSTLSKIIERWRKQVFADYLDGKKMALVNNKTMRMEFFGHLTEEMVGLYCVGRNQPWARVNL